jgi:Clostridium P-47 protein
VTGATAAAPPDVATSTFGWDTVFAIDVDHANAAIAAAGAWPASFQHADPKTMDVAGKFGAWQIVGGAGREIHLSIPLTDVTLTSATASVPVESAVARVQVLLTFHRQGAPEGEQPVPGVVPVGPHDIKLKTSADDGSDVATVLDIEYPYLNGQEQDPVVDVYLTVGLQAWLSANLEAFQHAFSTIDLGARAAHDQFQWLMPTVADYACVERVNARPLFGVLAMTAAATADQAAVAELSSAAIPDGATASFVISARRVLDELVRNSLPNAFVGLRADDASLSASGHTLTVSRHIPLKPVHYGGLDYECTLIELTAALDTGPLIVDSWIDVKLAEGIVAHCHHRAGYAIHAVRKADGTTTLDYALDPNVTEEVEHTVTQDPGYAIADEILSVVAMIVVIAIGIATDGVGLAIAGVVAALIMGAVQIIPELIATIGTDDAPAIDLMVVDATAPIVWPGSSGFQLTSADLSGCLRLGGTLVAA